MFHVHYYIMNSYEFHMNIWKNVSGRVSESRSAVSDSATPWTIAHQALLCPWDSLGKNTGVGCHSLLQGIHI